VFRRYDIIAAASTFTGDASVRISVDRAGAGAAWGHNSPQLAEPM